MDPLTRINPRLELKVSKRARRMALRLDVHERVINLVVPPRARLEKAYDFARENRDWIEEKLNTLPDPVPFEDETIIPICGRNVVIRLFYDPELKTTNIILKPNELIVVTNKKDPTPRIIRFLKEEARRVLRELAEEKADLIGKKVRSVVIRDPKSRWGSCATNGHLSFSWRLIFAPVQAMDYVVAHEVAHMSHMHHGKRFWDLCEDLSKSYKAGKKWMSDHGHLLMSYGQEE